LGEGQNQNYDKTIHEGIESSLDVKLNDWLTFFGNYTLTKAFFDGGEYNKNEIPLVPRHKGSVALRFLLPKNIIFNITATYVGERYFLNDQANAYSRLNGYMVADTNLSWRCKDLSVTLGINNIFNKKYSEYAGVLVNAGWESSSGITWPAGSKFYYPSPERNFSLKLEYKF
jgi:iron complex outermembrane receptor protein